MPRKILYVFFALLAILVGLYPTIYFIQDRKFGLLQSKSDILLSDFLWNLGFYTHIILGGIALLTGWIQFNKKIRTTRVKLHRNLGKLYVICVLLSASAAFYIALYATGGSIPSVGFAGLAITWFGTTLSGYIHIMKGRVDSHRQMMVYSYAACFAAVTLRIWLPLLTGVFNDFTIAYKIVAYLCWIPNIIVAYFINRGWVQDGYSMRNDAINLSDLK
jgi:uncharacterized membrane protein